MSLAYAAEHQIDSAEKYLDLYMVMQDSLKIDEEILSSFTDSFENSNDTLRMEDEDPIDSSIENKSNKLWLTIFSSWYVLTILIVGIIIFIFVVHAMNMASKNRSRNKTQRHK